MKLAKLLAVIAVLVVIAAVGAWLLWPVQILVMANRFAHPVAANQAVRWAEGPQGPRRKPAAQHCPDRR